MPIDASGRALGVCWGFAVSAVLFGAAHLGHGSWLAAAEIAINGGLIMGMLYIVTWGLWMSIGLPAAWDFTEDSFLGVKSHYLQESGRDRQLFRLFQESSYPYWKAET